MLSFILKLLKGKNQKSAGAALSATENMEVSATSTKHVSCRLTLDLIDRTDDEELAEVIWDMLWEDHPYNSFNMTDVVNGLSRIGQMVYILRMLDAEVCNGGFNQFFYNPSRQFAHVAPDILATIGAHKLADLMVRANDIYERENEKITKYQDGTLKGFSKSYEDNPLQGLDSEYYDLCKEENIDIMMAKFIRKNKLEFVSAGR